MSQTLLFTESDLIDVYTRKQAIEDGVLVQLSGPGYEGDTWVPEMVRESGFIIPVAITATAFAKYVDLTPAAKRACNDIQGRLWDVLHMMRLAVARCPNQTNVIWFDVYCVVDRIKPRCCRLKSICGPGDQGEPVLTIMLPNED